MVLLSACCPFFLLRIKNLKSRSSRFLSYIKSLAGPCTLTHTHSVLYTVAHVIRFLCRKVAEGGNILRTESGLIFKIYNSAIFSHQWVIKKAFRICIAVYVNVCKCKCIFIGQNWQA